MAGELDNADEIYETLNVICDGEPAADVMYAVGKIIAHGIATQSTDKNPDATFKVLRETVDLELSRFKPQLVR